MQIVVSSLNGFPPISGMEVSQIQAKSGAVGMTLLDRADNHIVVACGSKVFQQSPGGEILYPGPEAFTSAGLTLTRLTATITPADPALADLVAGGAFQEVCTASAAGAITATFNVKKGEEYTVIPYFAETSCASTPPCSTQKKAHRVVRWAPGRQLAAARAWCCSSRMSGEVCLQGQCSRGHAGDERFGRRLPSRNQHRHLQGGRPQHGRQFLWRCHGRQQPDERHHHLLRAFPCSTLSPHAAPCCIGEARLAATA